MARLVFTHQLCRFTATLEIEAPSATLREALDALTVG